MCNTETIISPPAKKMEALSSIKMTVENCLGTINICLFWISLTMVTLSADHYCGTLCLQWPFFAKCLIYFAKVLSFCMKMPGVIHPTRQLFMAVNLIGYGSVPILHSVFYLSLHPWEAPGWQVMALGAAVKQVISSWLQKVDSNVFTLEYKPWYHCGANAKMVVVTMLRSDVYHLLHMCHVLIEVPITFRHESVCYLIFLSSFYVHCSLIRWFHKYWVFWMVQFLCHFLIIFTCITCSSSDFHPAMPTQYCNLPYISVIY